MRLRRVAELVLLAVAGILLLLACDRNTEAFIEGEKPRSPDLARIFPEADPSVPPRGESPSMPAAPQRGASPVQRQAQISAPSVGKGDTISGIIALAPEFEDAVPAQGLLFVIARAAGVRAGPPMAVLRLPSPSFPLKFEIGPGNVMIPSMRFQGDIDISVRVDGDGNAMTRLPGDLAGQAEQSHNPGASGVRILLDQKL